MATFVRLPSGSWRAVIRRKSRYASQTFALRQDARAWALEAERRVDLDDRPEGPKIAALDRFGGLIDKYVADLKKSGKTLGRTKAATLERLKRDLGELKLAEIDREGIIMFGRVRAKSGAGPATVSMDIGMIKLVMQYCAAVHDIDAKVEPIALGRYALKHLNLIGKPGERDRRPTNSELKKLMGYWDDNDHQSIPMTRIVKFAIASGTIRELKFNYRLRCSDHTRVVDTLTTAQLAVTQLAFASRFHAKDGQVLKLAGQFTTNGEVKGTMSVIWRRRHYGTCRSGVIHWQAATS